MNRFSYSLFLSAIALGLVNAGDSSFGISSIRQFPTASEGKTLLTLFGSSLTDNTEIKIGDTPCTRTLWSSSTKMKCGVPPGVGADLTVTVDGGGARHVELRHAFSYAAPDISYALPVTGSKQGNRLMQLRGYDFGTFDSTPKIIIGATRCLETKWVSSEQISCVTPPATRDGVQNVTVIVGGQSKTEAVYYYKEPVVGGNWYDQIDPLGTLSRWNISVEFLANITAQTSRWVVDHLDDITNRSATASSLVAKKSSPIEAVLLARAVVFDAEDGLGNFSARDLFPIANASASDEAELSRRFNLSDSNSNISETRNVSETSTARNISFPIVLALASSPSPSHNEESGSQGEDRSAFQKWHRRVADDQQKIEIGDDVPPFEVEVFRRDFDAPFVLTLLFVIVVALFVYSIVLLVTPPHPQPIHNERTNYQMLTGDPPDREVLVPLTEVVFV